jgi:Zn-dependent peptidase ImmA (M78 family)
MTVLERPNYTCVKQTVRGLIAEFSLENPPVNPVKIARHKGIDVIFARFSGESKSKISGFYDVEENSIYVNEDEYPLRQTFTVAHELGHALLHKKWAASDDYKVLYRDSDYDGNDHYEKEANAFAAHLLVPRFMLDMYWETNSVESLSRLFAVSVPMIKNRLSFEYGI